MSRLALLILLAAATAHADPVATYAVVVGSNAGGPGQTDLRYAEDDARRVGRFLTELGGYEAAAVDVVVHPTPDELRARLDALQTRVHADLAAGRKARVLFYYSGHARATALDLGSAQLPLAELRTRLFSVPATLTVVVLDACQSGAFSRVKGAAPAADFSFNSRHQLDASGIAVLASSSGSELSQESEQLRSSYFTHHLLVGMRGAADGNRDGQVSIDEAYRYAYHQTLLATAETAVGGQHVSLEVDLKGHGEVPMSFPRAATSSIELPAAMDGKALVHDRRAKAVVAETYKAKGAPVRIAVAPGDYEVLVRKGDKLARCQLTAGQGGSVVDLDRCTTETVVEERAKGGEQDMRLEIAFGLLASWSSAYTRALDTFGYEPVFGAPVSLGGTLLRPLTPSYEIGVSVEGTADPGWRREDTDTMQSISWWTTTVSAVVRGTRALSSTGRFANASVFAQLGGGVALARTMFTDAAGEETADVHVGPAFAVRAGLQFGRRTHVILATSLEYTMAIQNEIGDRHDGGGQRFTLGLVRPF